MFAAFKQWCKETNEIWSLSVKGTIIVSLIGAAWAFVLVFGSDINLAQPLIDSQDFIAQLVELK